MGAYILRRLLLMIPTLLGILFVSFVVIQFAPGGPVERIIAQLTGNDISATSRVSGGGADIIAAGAGNDTVSYYGTETSIDGGTGTNTLVLRAAAVVNLANGDQTTGDATSVSNFQNVDASILTTGSTITGSASPCPRRRITARRPRA